MMVMIRKIYVILGTKAQLIKMAPVMAELQRREIDYRFIFTGQHRETIDQLRENFGVKKPDVILYDGADITGVVQMFFWSWRILLKVLFSKKKIFGDSAPEDVLLVHGDTFSTVLGSLMGRFAGIKVGHVESGLRSFNYFHPFPEELTRVVTFYLSDYYFCPGDFAMKNLAKFKGKKVNLGANTLFDALQLARENFERVKVDIPKGKYAVCSVHRFENIFKKDRLEAVVDILERTVRKLPVLFIMHLPTKKQLEKFGLMERLEAIEGLELRPRYDYLEFIKLVDAAEFLMTDGGSNQEECFYLGKPCLLLRMATERDEGLDENVLLSGYSDDLIDSFVLDYSRYEREPLDLGESPSKLIVDYLVS